LAKPLPRLSAARPRKPAIALAAVSFLIVLMVVTGVAFRCLLGSSRESGRNLNEISKGRESGVVVAGMIATL
jgi:hypothetical protein